MAPAIIAQATIAPAIITPRRFVLILAGLIATAFHSQALCAEPSQPIYDGRLDPSPATISKADQALVKRLVFKRASEFWHGEPDFSVQDVALGSFTIKGARQKAFLYHFSNSGHNFDIDGIVVVRNGKADAHFGYQGGAEYGIVRLPDLDGDGLNEIALQGGYTNMGETRSTIFIYSLRPKKERLLVSALTDDEWESGAARSVGKDAYQIFANSGRSPKFSSQKYTFTKNKWLRTGSLHRVNDEAGSQPYKLLNLKGKANLGDCPD
jgi:hypothetical protein